MNPTETFSKAQNPRLPRIQRISGILKVGVLIYLVVPLCFIAFNLKTLHDANATISIFNHQYASAANVPSMMYVFSALSAAVYFLGIISFYRLLCLYEKGVIFSQANVSEMKKVASYLIGYGLIALTASIMGKLLLPWIVLELISSPWILVGGAIYLVAWIMDEGRKIQEEQELTV